MIRLEVEDYCQECRDFTADVIPPRKEFPDWGGDCVMTDTIIHCEYRHRCSKIRHYLERQMRGEKG